MKKLLGVASLITIAIVIFAACGETTPEKEIVEVPVERIVVQEVIKEVPVDRIVEVEKEVIKEVEVEVEKEVIKEVAVERAVVQQVTLREPTGEVILGVVGLPPLIQLQSKDAPGTVGGFGVWWNIHEPLVSAKLMPPKMNPPVDQYVPILAESWVVAPDQTKITFQLRKGIQWHSGFGDFGDVTAEDVAWTYNNSFEEGSTGNAGEQLPPGHKVGWDATDK